MAMYRNFHREPELGVDFIELLQKVLDNPLLRLGNDLLADSRTNVLQESFGDI